MRYVRESLLPDEKVISEASVHWWVFAPGAMLLFLGVLSLPRGPGVGVVLILIGAILAGKGYITRMSTELALTDKRIIAKFGLGTNPIRTLLLIVALMGILGAAFTIREWWPLYAIGIWVYMAMIPAVEAAEQTVIQRVVPFTTQGRVFGFAQAFEAAAAPITAFLIAPIAEFFIIPLMDSREGQEQGGVARRRRAIARDRARVCLRWADHDHRGPAGVSHAVVPTHFGAVCNVAGCA